MNYTGTVTCPLIYIPVYRRIMNAVLCLLQREGQEWSEVVGGCNSRRSCMEHDSWYQPSTHRGFGHSSSTRTPRFGNYQFRRRVSINCINTLWLKTWNLVILCPLFRSLVTSLLLSKDYRRRCGYDQEQSPFSKDHGHKYI